MRELRSNTKKLGRIIFDLVDETNNVLATILATPFHTQFITNEQNLVLTVDERIYCQLEAKKTLNSFI